MKSASPTDAADIGAREIYVAVPVELSPTPVRRFETFTDELKALVAWLVELKITTVALEATSVYWIPLAELLEEAGIAVCLVNPRHVQNVSGRKSDVMDCQWLQYLHSVGLLRGAFRPAAEIRGVRAIGICIRDAAGRPAAGISVAATSDRMPDARIVSFGRSEEHTSELPVTSRSRMPSSA